MSVGENLKRVKERIETACVKSGRNPSEVKLIAVTKTVGVDRIKEAIAWGQRCFGENYVQEAIPKIQALGGELEWHFIGHLQTNKVKQVLGRFHMIQTLDRCSLARELEKRSAGRDHVKVLIQVNIGKEGSKSGILAEELGEFLASLIAVRGIIIKGLMTIPPFTENPENARGYFIALRELRDRYRRYLPPPHSMDELSMGMTSDLEVAVEEGATMVRVGTAIFGPRPIV